MGKFKKMTTDAFKTKVGEEAMHKAIDVVDELMCTMEEKHPEAYEKFMHAMSEAIFGCHYHEETAKDEVEKMHSTDRSGAEHSGAHWSTEDVEIATSGLMYPEGTTRWDKYVAYNYAWHAFHDAFDDPSVLTIAYDIFFRDDSVNGKVWKYMSL